MLAVIDTGWHGAADLRSAEHPDLGTTARYLRHERTPTAIIEGVDRTTLIGALRRCGGVAQVCSVALEGGSEFQVFEGTTPASELATVYRRRAEHVRSIGLDHDGFDDVVTVLDERETGEVRLGQVTDRLANRHYALFLSPDDPDVLCCLWVHHNEWHDKRHLIGMSAHNAAWADRVICWAGIPADEAGSDSRGLASNSEDSIELRVGKWHAAPPSLRQRVATWFGWLDRSTADIDDSWRLDFLLRVGDGHRADEILGGEWEKQFESEGGLRAYLSERFNELEWCHADERLS